MATNEWLYVSQRFLLDFNEHFCKKCIFNGDMKNAEVCRNSDVIEVFLIELKNRIYVLYFGRFWASRFFYGRFLIEG